MGGKQTADSIQKDLNWAKALSVFEGACFFVAGICAFLADNLLGYISGALMVILGCGSIFPAFFGGDEYFLNLGMSLSEDSTVDEFGEQMEEATKE